jgi:UDP-GlcNAc:undecaprenyl-phosphate GlcNAc-1-phosphate transferase
VREYLFVLLVAMATTFLAVPAIYRLAIKVGAFTKVRDRDVHAVPIPRLGGVAIFIGFAAATLTAAKLPFLTQVFDTPELWGVLLGGGLMCLLGAVDDVHELDPLTKLGGQIVAAGIMAFFGVQLYSLPVFGVTTVLPAPVLATLTILIVLVSTNAVNFIDGLDGLASGVVAIAATTFFAYSYYISRGFDPPNVFSSASFISAALLGCCLGFLPHNFYPARLFMGDSGALLLGLLLAAAMISTGGVSPDQVSGTVVGSALLPLLVPTAIILLPLLDVVLAVIRRTRAGRRPWSPDAQHLHHRMLQIGHGHRRAVLLLWLWAAVASFGCVAFVFLDFAVACAIVVAAVAITAALTIWLPRFSAHGHRPKVFTS